MFDNVGGKIKIIAKVYFWLLEISSAITGLILLFNQYTWWIGLITIVGGFFVSWIGALFLHGYGDIVENTEATRENTYKAAQKAEENQRLLKELIENSSRTSPQQPAPKYNDELPPM